MSTFRIKDFAQLAGVTVRALHHYDRLKLLSPAHRSERGYRLYYREDLGRLERIVVLRFLGLSLHEIGVLLNTTGRDGAEPLTITLARQRGIVHDRRERLDCVLRAIEHAQKLAQDCAEPEWPLYQTILKEIQMQERTEWTEKYYSPKAVETLRDRRASRTPEQNVEISVRWQDLFAEVQKTLDRQVLPDSPEGRTLVARWMRLADEFTQGDPEIGEGYRRMVADESQWPDDERAARLRAGMPKPEHQAFFNQAVQACLRHG